MSVGSYTKIPLLSDSRLTLSNTSKGFSNVLEDREYNSYQKIRELASNQGSCISLIPLTYQINFPIIPHINKTCAKPSVDSVIQKISS